MTTIKQMTIEKPGANPPTSLVRCRLTSLRRQRAVGFRTAVAIKLPDLSHFLDHVEIEIGDQHFVFIAAGLGEDFAARIAEITLAVKFSDIPRRFRSYAVDRAHEVAVRRGVGGLLQLPQMFRESCNGC